MNVVFIVLDTVRRDFISPFNEDIEFTENIESLADEGTVFEEAVSQAPWTLPSHGSMFTGMYPWDHGATQTNFDLDVEKNLLAERFKENDYHTACFSANPFISERFGTVDGFNRVETTIGLVDFGINPTIDRVIRKVEEKIGSHPIEKIEQWAAQMSYRLNFIGENSTGKLIESSKEFIEENEDEDFFLFMNLMDCHLPWLPDKKYKNRHAAEVKMSDITQYPDRAVFSDEEIDEEALKKVYSAQVDYLDDKIGELSSYINEQGLEEETIFVIVGDHGENLGENGMMGHFFSVDENLIHEPLIIKSPNMSEDRIEDQMELKELYNIILEQSNLIEDYEIGKDLALGGEDRPEMDLAKTPPSEREKHDKRKYYVRTPNKKAVLTSKGEFEEIDLGDKEDSVDTSKLKSKLKELEGSYEESEDGKKQESVDEEVKQQLEKLGYMNRD